MTYVTKESYVINHYAMKAYVIKVLFQFELGVLCHKNICH
jgi:hypothetical protein